MKITNHLEEVSVFERTADRFQMSNPLIDIVLGEVLSIDTVNKIIHLLNHGKLLRVLFQSQKKRFDLIHFWDHDLYIALELPSLI